MAEHLAKTQLLAPVGELRLEAVGVQALVEDSGSLLPDVVRTGETLYLTLERIAARLGPERVQQPVLGDDHRPEWQTRWRTCGDGRTASRRKGRQAAVRAPAVPEPAFLLDPPLRLAVREHRPHYQGPLTLLVGPDRIEGGWWDRIPDTKAHRKVTRDYWIAVNENAGVLAVYQERLSGTGNGGDDKSAVQAWFLHWMLHDRAPLRSYRAAHHVRPPWRLGPSRLRRTALPQQLQLPEGREAGPRNWSCAPWSSATRRARDHRRVAAWPAWCARTWPRSSTA